MINVLPFETSDLPSEDEDEIDPFAELEIGTKTSYKAGNDALSVFEAVSYTHLTLPTNA